jgi:dolichol kinase
VINSMIFLPTTIIFLALSTATLVYTVKNWKFKINNHSFVNELLITILLFNAGVLYPFMYQFHSPNITITTLNMLWLYSSIIFVIEMTIWLLMLSYNAVMSKRDPNLMKRRDYEDFKRKLINNWSDNVKDEFGRKILHLFTCSVVFIFWIIGMILDRLGILELIGLDIYDFSYWWIITIGYAFVYMFQIADLARLNYFYTLPKWAKKWYLSMRPNELDTFIASTPLVLSFVPFIFAPFPIFASVSLITTGADAAACLIGKKYGQHQLKNGSDKTIEGFIAGGSSTFIIVIAIMIVFNQYILVDATKLLSMAISATILFLIIDYFVDHISDNILNPLMTGFAMWIIYIL